jgi:hypothetical protein
MTIIAVISFAFQPAFALQAGTVSGKVVSQDNEPVDGATVSIVNASTNDVYANATTNSNGNFIFHNVNPTFNSSAGESSDGHAGYKILVYKTPYGSGYGSPFSLDTGENLDNMDVTLQPGLTSVTISTSILSSVMKDEKCAMITATVSDSSGNPAPDGTLVDFYVDVEGWTNKNGSVSGEGSQYATAKTSGGKAFVYYGWFPDDATPAHNKVVASVQYFSSIKASTDLYFPRTASVTPTSAATVTPTPMPNVTATSTPVPSKEPTSTPLPTATPTITPTITNTVEPIDQPVTAMSVLGWVVYIIIVAVGVAQIIALLIGFRVLKKKK